MGDSAGLEREGMTTDGAAANTLYYGDNLPVLREYVADESVDLVYLDPPFNSNASYNVLFKERTGEESPAQIKAFTDTWEWTQEAERTFEQDIIMSSAVPSAVKEMIRAFREFVGNNAMMAYLVMMAPRLVELHRVLKPTGSIYLHCDPTASHYLKILMDTVFGKEQFRSEITWKRTTSHNDAVRNYGALIQTSCSYYTKGEGFLFQPQYASYSQEHLDKFYRYARYEWKRYGTTNLRSPSPRPNLDSTNIRATSRTPTAGLFPEKEWNSLTQRDGFTSPRISRGASDARYI